MKQLFTLSILILTCNSMRAQVVINEVIFGPGQAIELKNVGSAAVDVSSYQLCSWPVYNQIGSLSLVSGNLNLGPGELLVVSGHSFNIVDDEMGLYLSAPFGTASNMLDYVEWGSTGHQRSGIAVQAGIWTTGDFVSGGIDSSSIEYDGNGDSSSDWAVSATNTQGAENSNSGLLCEAGGFVVGNQNICEGGTATFQLVLTGVAPWTFVYSLNGINQPSVTTSDSPYQWELTEEGEYNVVTVTDAECEAPGNGSVAVNYVPAPTAALSGNSPFCSSDTTAALQVAFTGQGPWTYGYSIDGVDQGNTTVGINPSDLLVSNPGNYIVTSVSNNGCTGEAAGEVAVEFAEVEGGNLTSNGSAEDIVVCVDDNISDALDFVVASNSGSLESLVVTDDTGLILAIPAANTIDFEGTPGGVCVVLSISYEDGLSGLEVGNTVPVDLDGCFELSNPINLIRQTGTDCTNSLEDLSSIEALRLYPNPVQNELSISFELDRREELTIGLYDLMGKQVAGESYQTMGGTELLRFDVSELSAGAYLFLMSNAEGASIQRRFIK